MKNLEIESVRTPRDISKMRSIINKAVLYSEPMKDLFAKYQKQLERENINGNARASI
jgi:hypothetical protein